jgi:hypothetical protein
LLLLLVVEDVVEAHGGLKQKKSLSCFQKLLMVLVCKYGNDEVYGFISKKPPEFCLD